MKGGFFFFLFMLGCSLFQDLPPFLKAFSHQGLIAPVTGFVVDGATDLLGQMLLTDQGIAVVMGILVALAIAQFLHQFGGRIAQMERHR